MKNNDYTYQISEALDQLQALGESLTDIFHKAIEELSEYDQEIVDIYHYIEFGKYNAVEGWKILKRLKEVLQARRKIKDNYNFIMSISQKITATSKNYKLEANTKKSQKYHVKTDVLSDIFDFKKGQKTKFED